MLPTDNQYLHALTPNGKNGKWKNLSLSQKKKTVLQGGSSMLESPKIYIRDINKIVDTTKQNISSMHNSDETMQCIPENTSNTTTIPNWHQPFAATKENESESCNNVISISSDDEITKDIKERFKMRKGGKRLSRQRSRKSKEKEDESNKSINTEMKSEETIPVRRKLTRSTNLKTYNPKHHPKSQTRIDNFFKSTPDPNRVGYFDTFEKSRQPELGSKSIPSYADLIKQGVENMRNLSFSANTEKTSNEDIPQLMDCSQITGGNTPQSKDNLIFDQENRHSGTDYLEMTEDLDCFEMPIEQTDQRNGQKSAINEQSISKIKQVDETNDMPYLCSYYPCRKNNSQIDSFNKIQVSKTKKQESNINSIPTTIVYNSDVYSDNTFALFDYNRYPSEKTLSAEYLPNGEISKHKIEPKHRNQSLRSVMTSSSSITEKDRNISKKTTARRTARKRLSFKKTFEKISGSRYTEALKADHEELNVPEVAASALLKIVEEIRLTSTPSSTKNYRISKNKNDCGRKSDEVIEEIDLTTHITPPKKPKCISATTVKRSRCQVTESKKPKTAIKTKKGRIIECPPYKIIEGTTFAVDAFRFGYIEGITHYFLTHFHADHYIGLKKTFCKPVYLSEITAKLVKGFIRTSNEFLHVMNLNEPVIVNGIEVTAIDANHCPGAIMLLFKFPNGLCTLHTGDFRASPVMEEEAIFWNNTIHTIYLDTTYLSNRYAFKPQCDAIDEADRCIKDFQLKHIGEKILYVFGSYVIGKEKIWTVIAEYNNFNVWTDGNRRKALEIMDDNNMLKYLVDDPTTANIHILTMRQLSYDYLSEHLTKYSDYFDIILAIRPSGWERNSTPQYRGRVNIIGIEYSEHSSYDELRRFVCFLQPQKIISTVPFGSDPMKTAKVPKSWLNNQVKSRTKGYQTDITTYIKINGLSKRRLEYTINDPISDLENAKFYNSLEDVGVLDATKSLQSLEDNNVDEVNEEEKIKDISEPETDWWLR